MHNPFQTYNVTCNVTYKWDVLLAVCWIVFRHDMSVTVNSLLSTTFTFTYPLTARVVGAPQMISQPVSSIFPCSPLPSGTWRTPGLSIPWCCLPTFYFVFLVLFFLSLCPAIWYWPDLMTGRHDHTTAVCFSLRWSGSLGVVRLPAGPWHGLHRC